MVQSITEGIDALGEVTVHITDLELPSRTFSGHGADTDIIVASAKAYIAAMNRMIGRLGSERASFHPRVAAAAAPLGTVT